MEEKMECMCIHCGISHHIVLQGVSMEADPYDPDRKLLNGATCTECGGVLALVGKVGVEPSYRLK